MKTVKRLLNSKRTRVSKDTWENILKLSYENWFLYQKGELDLDDIDIMRENTINYILETRGEEECLRLYPNKNNNNMINNDIITDYCSFEVSKLLKKKGLDCGTSKTAYSLDGSSKISPASSFYNEEKYPIEDCPHHIAIKWLRINYNLDIEVNTFTEEYGNKIRLYVFEIRNYGEQFIYNPDGTHYDSFEEATEAALLYTLKNLI